MSTGARYYGAIETVPFYLETVYGIAEFLTGSGGDAASAWMSGPSAGWVSSAISASSYFVSATKPEDLVTDWMSITEENFNQSIDSDMKMIQHPLAPGPSGPVPKFITLGSLVPTYQRLNKDRSGHFKKFNFHGLGLAFDYKKSRYKYDEYDEHGYKSSGVNTEEFPVDTVPDRYMGHYVVRRPSSR